MNLIFIQKRELCYKRKFLFILLDIFLESYFLLVHIINTIQRTNYDKAKYQEKGSSIKFQIKKDKDDRR